MSNQIKQIATYGYSRVYTIPGGPSGIFFSAGMTINADGSPHAYHPNGAPPGLDYLANAGKPGNWWGIATNSSGQPIVQGPGDPAPGFYVSTTALIDGKKKSGDPARYVDSEKVNFFVLPGGFKQGTKLGDFAVVVKLDSGLYEYAVYADIGPKDHIGEGSIALASALGINSNPKNGGVSSGIVYLTFPGSSNGWPLGQHEIEAAAAGLFATWGGMDRIMEIYG